MLIRRKNTNPFRWLVPSTRYDNNMPAERMVASDPALISAMLFQPERPLEDVTGREWEYYAREDLQTLWKYVRPQEGSVLKGYDYGLKNAIQWYMYNRDTDLRDMPRYTKGFTIAFCGLSPDDFISAPAMGGWSGLDDIVFYIGSSAVNGDCRVFWRDYGGDLFRPETNQIRYQGRHTILHMVHERPYDNDNRFHFYTNGLHRETVFKSDQSAGPFTEVQLGSWSGTQYASNGRLFAFFALCRPMCDAEVFDHANNIYGHLTKPALSRHLSRPVSTGTNTYYWTMQGGATLGGAADYQLGKQWTASGGMILAGAGAYSVEYPFAASGGLSSAGAAQYNAIFDVSPVGGLETAGGGIYSFSVNVDTQGGMVAAGGGGYSASLLYEASGGAVIGGSAEYSPGNVWEASGGLISGGSALYHIEVYQEGLGGAVSGGAADITYTPAGVFEWVMSGGMQSGGLAQYHIVFNPVMQGGLIANGGAIYSYESALPDVPIDATPGGKMSNSYATVAEADAYHATHLYADIWNNATETTKNNALIWATQLLDANMDWFGSKSTNEQALRHPRAGLYDADGYAIGSDEIDKGLKNGTSEFARLLIESDLPESGNEEQYDALKVSSIDIDFRDKNDQQNSLVPDSVYQLIYYLGDRKVYKTQGVVVSKLHRGY